LRDGWLHTGDVGRLDRDGLLRVLDRRSDLIVSGGENVRPAEVERVVEAHPRVREAAVIGAPDADLGQRVTACVVPADAERPPDLPELQAWCRARLAAFKVPRALRVLDALPRTASGKLRRAALR
jgi:acyl-CoA synthetase (AMP-forming)/AMP-acid ligase II